MHNSIMHWTKGKRRRKETEEGGSSKRKRRKAAFTLYIKHGTIRGQINRIVAHQQFPECNNWHFLKASVWDPPATADTNSKAIPEISPRSRKKEGNGV